MAEYRYPDADDRMTNAYVRRAEPYPGYWAASERGALDRVAGTVAGPLGPRAGVRALDAGCGEGRLLPWIATLAGRITALDADPDRLTIAANVAAGLADVDVRPMVGAIADLVGTDGDPYRFVVCSHVLQHIASTAVPPLLRRLHAVTAPGGYLLLSYCRSPVGAETYGIETLDDDRIVRRRMDRAAFDGLFTAGGAGAGLPLREIDPVRLADTARSAGWTETWRWTYHVVDDLGVLDRHADRDEVVNGSPALWRAIGRDMMALWRRD